MRYLFLCLIRCVGDVILGELRVGEIQINPFGICEADGIGGSLAEGVCAGH